MVCVSNTDCLIHSVRVFVIFKRCDDKLTKNECIVFLSGGQQAKESTKKKECEEETENKLPTLHETKGNLSTF